MLYILLYSSYEDMAELVDAMDLKSIGLLNLEGSSPSILIAESNLLDSQTSLNLIENKKNI